MIDVAFVHDEELNFEGLFLRDRDSGETFEVQRSIEFDEQDVAMGMRMDTYCLVWKGATYYGGIVEWAIDGYAFTVHLSNDAGAELGLPPLLAFDLDAAGVDVVRRQLPALCA